VSSNPNQRNWRGILIALLVIVIVLALIVTSVVLLTPPDDGPRVKGHRFKLQDILGHEFTPLRFNGSWVSGEYEQCKYQGIKVLCSTQQKGYDLDSIRWGPLSPRYPCGNDTPFMTSINI